MLSLDRPQIQRTTTSVSSFISTLNTFINGGRKHVVESRKTDSGKVFKNKQGNEEFRYNDINMPPQADTIRNLHAFPIAPFPGINEHLSGLTQTLLRKRLEPTEEKWVEERLSKALEFAYVPPDWGIEPRKPAEKEVKDSEAETDTDKPSTAVDRFSKRAKGSLTEEQLVERWNSAHTWFFNPPQTSFDDGEEYASGDEEEEEEDDFEDALNPPDAEAEAQAQATQGEDDEAAEPPPPVVMIQEAKPPVHKPVAGMPVLELGMSLKFMATGQL